ncbi:hypothetical protein [Myxococcus sp. CA039A]|uniref:hypothetical protein n=1 Tax=Myxococcus sp. CA039A TaxID=2741737 RepID=UPI00157AFC1F|nr:hypothetical protein [Myxococcus sp. CA039A]NTX58386.1 hypothetical protein [Myxococcus sp. CA039A]
MKLISCLLLTVLMPLSAGCATLAQRRCAALQDELEEANGPCNACRARLTDPVDAPLCAGVCAHPGVVGPAVVAACTPAPAVLSASTEPTASMPEDAGDVSADASVP